MAPSAQTAGGRRTARWTRETIVENILEWEARYGESPSSADWNPSLARWRGQEWRAERYREGRWPSTNAAKRAFDGSFDAAVRAAGLEPHKPGPRRGVAPAPRAIAAPAPAPVVVPEPAAVEPVVAVAVAGSLERRLRAAERRVERAEQATEEARRRSRRASERELRARRGRERAEEAERAAAEFAERRLEALAADADARVRAAADQADAAARDAVGERAERRRAELRAAQAETRLAAVERRSAAEPARVLGTAEERALAAEARERELALLVCGSARRLRPDELDALRTDGPSGPTALAAALRALARARGEGGVQALDAALGEVAAAAVRWRDRL